MALLGVTILLSRVPVTVKSNDASIFSFSFRNITGSEVNCRETSEAERAQLPAHMRQDKICQRGRVSTHVTIQVDDREVLNREYLPLGYRSDGHTTGYESFAMNPGTHRVLIRMKDKADEGRWDYEFERTLEFKRDKRLYVEFQKDFGFKLYE